MKKYKLKDDGTRAVDVLCDENDTEYRVNITDWVIVRSWCSRENNKTNVVTEYGCSEQFTQVFIAVCEGFVVDICKRLNMMAAKSNSCWHYEYKELEKYNECFEEKDV